VKNRLINIILESGLFKRLIAFLQRIKLGKEKVGLYDAIVIFIQKLSNDQVLDRANGVAFSFTLAIFPAIIFLFTLVPFIGFFFPEVTSDVIIDYMETIMPESLYAAADTTIHDIILRKRGGLLSFGFLLALYLSTNGMSNLMRAFNSCYKTIETRGFFKMRITATGLTFVLAFCILTAAVLLIVSEHFINNFTFREFIQEKVSIDVLVSLRYLILFGLFQIAISSIYFFAPAIHEKWSFFSIGSIFASLACILSSFIFTFFVNNFGNYNTLYGSIGVLLVLMLWLSILSLILLVGFEMNAAIHKVKMDKLSIVKK
jgi:membrane protein